MVKFSKIFLKALKEYEQVKYLYEKRERELILIERLYTNNLSAKVTINSNDEILYDKNKNFILDKTRGNEISLQDYYFRKKRELEEMAITLNYVTNEFEKLKKICYSDNEKYKEIENIKSEMEMYRVIYSIDKLREK